MFDVHESGLFTIYRGDCQSLLGRIVADALITDPPYGQGYKSNHNTSRRRDKWSKYQRRQNFSPIRGDDRPFDPLPLISLAPKVLLWGANYYADKLPPSRGWIVWDKREGMRSNVAADCEIAWTNQAMPPRLFSHLWSGLLRRGEENLAKGGRKLHPNQKPVALMDWTLTVLGIEEGQTVFDPYMGSGSLGVACVRRRIRYVGIEIDPQYFKIAGERLAKEVGRPHAFDQADAPALPRSPVSRQRSIFALPEVWGAKTAKESAPP
ncbi:MAG: DNA methyltransferase [Sinobacteraceae bacterium]|nr:DNA methyltransferase [Nevskiaceae bacterium]